MLPSEVKMYVSLSLKFIETFHMECTFLHNHVLSIFLSRSIKTYETRSIRHARATSFYMLKYIYE